MFEGLLSIHIGFGVLAVVGTAYFAVLSVTSGLRQNPLYFSIFSMLGTLLSGVGLVLFGETTLTQLCVRAGMYTTIVTMLTFITYLNTDRKLMKDLKIITTGWTNK